MQAMKSEDTAPRLLLVSYHYGPGCETGGFRWNATTRQLTEAGWHVDVVTLERADADWANWVAGFRAGALAVVQVPAPDWPTRLLGGVGRLLRRVRPRRTPAVATPASREPVLTAAEADALPIWRPGTRRSLRTRVLQSAVGLRESAEAWLWSGRATREGARLLRRGKYDAVLVSSPPHITHVVGVRLHRRFGIPYVGDYRDPWVDGLGPLESFMNPASRMVGRLLEGRIVRSSSAIVHNTPRALDVLRRVRPAPGVRRAAIPNGYDAVPAAGRPDRDVFRLVYTGWVHPYMDMRVLFRACRRFADRHRLGPDRFSIDLMGVPDDVCGQPLVAVAGAYGVATQLRVHPRGNRDDARALQERAAVLAAFDYPHGLAVVMKFYDYVSMYGSLLLIGEPDGALSEAARRVGARVVSPMDVAGQDAVLDAAYDRWRQGTFDAVNDAGGLYRREHRTREMEELLLSLGSRTNPSPAPAGDVAAALVGER